MPEFFYRLPQNIAAIFWGRNLLWHAAAIVLTMIIVMSGGDWAYYCATRGEWFYQFAQPAIRLGMVVPVFGSLAILVFGEINRLRRAITTAWALGQAALLGYFVSCCYKALTGRLPPPYFRHFRTLLNPAVKMVDSSHGFQLGLMKGGIFWGWPSSHTTVAFAMSTCLIKLVPKNKTVAALALLYAVYIGLGVSVTIHWLSEFVAGAIFGSVTGLTVGQSFKTKLELSN